MTELIIKKEDDKTDQMWPDTVVICMKLYATFLGEGVTLHYQQYYSHKGRYKLMLN